MTGAAFARKQRLSSSLGRDAINAEKDLVEGFWKPLFLGVGVISLSSRKEWWARQGSNL